MKQYDVPKMLGSKIQLNVIYGYEIALPSA